MVDITAANAQLVSARYQDLYAKPILQSDATLSVEDRLAAEALIVDVDGFEGR